MLSGHIFNFWLVLGFLAAGFVLWRKAHEEHYDEYQFFDGYLIAVMGSMVVARLGFILLHPGQFGLNLFRWLDVFGSPGFNWLFAGVGASLFLWRYAQRQKWDVYEVMDYWVTGLSLGMSLIWIGWWFAGVRFGYETALPLGMSFPGVVGQYHPTQLYAAVAFGGLFWYLSWLEYHYRTFEWYKARRKSAQTGFLLGTFLIGWGIISVGINWLMPPQLAVWGVRLDWWLAAAAVLAGIGVLYWRSGRNISWRRPWKSKSSPTGPVVNQS